MAVRIWPGPVVAVELVAAARRWQTYALRAAVVGVMLLAISVVALRTYADAKYAGDRLNLSQYAEIGSSFARTVLGLQLALVMFAAPAATAGAICLDKSRGNLMLLLTTQLTATEFVVGKLIGRLWPVLGLIAVSLPVLFILSLLGGINAELLIGALIVLTGAAVFGSALALLTSIYVDRTHEALLVSYLIMLVWELAYTIVMAVAYFPVGIFTAPGWLTALSPHALIAAPTQPDTRVTAEDYLLYLAMTFGWAVVFVGIAIWQLRAVMVRQSGRLAATRRRRGFFLRRVQLDRDPLRWYERFRRRPSLAARLVWWVFGILAVSGTAFAVATSLFQTPSTGPTVSYFGWLVSYYLQLIGFLLVTIGAVTALGDERSRGSLDILLTTPVLSQAIVRAKWRSAFAVVPKIVLLGFLTTLASWYSSEGRRLFPGQASDDNPLIEWAIAGLALLQPLAYGAMLTSMGLYFSVSIKRFSRAVGTAVAVYVALTWGWSYIAAAFAPSGSSWMYIFAISPSQCSYFLNMALTFGSVSGWRTMAIVCGILSTLVCAIIARSLYWRTMVNFDRCMGRIPQRGLLEGAREESSQKDGS